MTRGGTRAERRAEGRPGPVGAASSEGPDPCHIRRRAFPEIDQWLVEFHVLTKL